MRLRLLLVAALAVSGCAGSLPPPTDGDLELDVRGLPPATKASLRVMTWNAGLAPGVVPLAKERPSVVADYLANGDADVVCVQEVWRSEDRQTITRRLTAAGYRTYWSDTTGQHESRRDRCDPGDLDSLLACARQECGQWSPEDQPMCATYRCRAELAWLLVWHRRCLNCLVASIGNSPDEITNHCLNGSASRVYGGANGLILASRYPVSRLETVPLKSSGVNRVGLLARVKVPGHGAVEVGCVHLSAEQLLDPTERGYDSWEEEVGDQLRTVARRLGERADGELPQLLIGDFNFSSDILGASASSLPAVRALVTRLGFAAPAETAQPPFCSWCRGNLLSHCRTSRLIDQAFLRQPTSGRQLIPVAAWRGADDAVTVRDRQGKTVTTHRSDHCAVWQDFAFGP